MSFLDKFKPAPSAAANPQPAGPANPQPKEGQPAAPEQPKGPLDQFQFLVQNKDEGKGEGEKSKPKIDKAAQALTPETLQQLVGNIDFTQHISQDSLKKLQEGDSSGMMSAFNEMLRAAVGQAAQLNANLGDIVMDNRLQSLQEGLSSNIRAELTAQEQATMPGFDNPLVQESMKGIADRIRQAHPDASPKEVAAMSRDYYIALASAINPEIKNPDKNIPDVDWLEYISS